MTDVKTHVKQNCVALDTNHHVHDSILDSIGNARIVLIGEASHGTHEFYKMRAEITKRLIKEKGFVGVAVEADFPDAYRINRYVHGTGNDKSALDAFGDFERFPLWMWRNTEVLDFVTWLRLYNDALPNPQHKTGFYGLDLYSMHSSMSSVLKYLAEVDPEAAKKAKSRYSCFDHHGEDPQSYGYAASFNIKNSCEKQCIEQLKEMQSRRQDLLKNGGFVSSDEYFYAEQNAKLVKDAEEYYREMFRGRVSSWNLRDRHMMETLTALDAHIGSKGLVPKIVVWEHNSHLGDARATDMSKQGEWNVGQLVKEKYGKEAFNIGFTTYTGTVTCASNWDEPAQVKKVKPGMDGSWELLFHEVGVPRFYLDLCQEQTKKLLGEKSRLERAIGVIYRPETERLSHYFKANIAGQFDGVIHLDVTRALEPLDKVSSWKHIDLPDTFPEGL